MLLTYPPATTAPRVMTKIPMPLMIMPTAPPLSALGLAVSAPASVSVFSSVSAMWRPLLSICRGGVAILMPLYYFNLNQRVTVPCQWLDGFPAGLPFGERQNFGGKSREIRG